MKPIERILIPTDFSDEATRALIYGIRLAQATEATLVILHAYQVPNPVMASPYPVATAYTNTTVDYQRIKREVEAELEALAHIHLPSKLVPYELISVCDLPEEAIEETVYDRKIDLIVMGMRGGGTWDKLVGSTTTHVMRQVACPLVAVPVNAVFTPVDRILLAIDYERIERADTFQTLVTLANVFQAQIDVLHVTPKQTRLSRGKLAVGETLDRMLRHAHHAYCHEENDDILDGLRAYLQRHDHEVGMLAMIPRQHNFWNRIVRGSVTDNVLFETDRPVFVHQG